MTPAFDRLSRNHHRELHVHCYRMLASFDEAEDAVQETFLRAWKYLDSFDARGSFEGWLIRICRNCLTDLAARRREDASLDAVTDVCVAIAPASGALELEDLLHRLPLPQREVILLCAVLGYDYETAAALLGVPIGTVRSRVSRGRAALATMLERADAEHTDLAAARAAG